MAGFALKRLMTEFKRKLKSSFSCEKNNYLEISSNPPEGIFAGPSTEDNFFEWDCLISGPEGTCFENGIFPAKITFPEVGFLT